MKPWELVQAALGGDVALIKRQSGIDEDDAQKMVDYLRQIDLVDVLKLETIMISDVPKISFETEPGQFKPIDELATGTKSIVIVSIAMVEGNYPLIIDQPEDSLNTEFIYNQIVTKLRNEKEMRQFIFASHNANIVVSAETDLTHVLTATASQGSIKSSGGIDNPNTNNFLLLHLEGGPHAFDLRTSKYIRS
jgi:ABC-type Na+ transport system ATPase subunit NatA